VALTRDGLPVAVVLTTTSPQRDDVIDDGRSLDRARRLAPLALAHAHVTHQDALADGLQRPATDTLVAGLVRAQRLLRHLHRRLERGEAWHRV
jgi:hypothetical protein